jgi:hypothetical protein
MGCNCKKPQVLNNLKSVDHLRLAAETYDNTLGIKNIDELDDFDKMQIFNAFKSLFPNAKTLPTLDDAIGHLKSAKQSFSKK